MEKKALVSTIKSVVVVVKNLDESRRIFEEGLGLMCVGEAETSAQTVGKLWQIGDGNFRCARFARDGEDFGMIDLIENKNAAEPIRDKNCAFDYGIFTLNYRTNNLEKAVEKLRQCGAETVSETQSYNVGKPMLEVMMNLPSGERLTIIQIGDATDDAPFFREAIATAGMVVPQMSKAKEFYQNVLGLNVSITFQATGSPFDKLLGAPDGTGLDFATLTSDGNWTGKVELLELFVPDKTGKDLSARTDLRHSGYFCLSFLTDDLNALYEKLKTADAEILCEPFLAERPFHTGKRAMFVRASGGELVEFIEEK